MASGSSSRALVLLLLTSGFFISGLVLDYMPMIIDDYIKQSIELATNEEIISFWTKPPIDIHTYYWLYSIENPEQFKSMGERAQIRKLGPFHFTAKIQKRIIELAANKYRIIYNSTRFMRLNESFPGNADHYLDEQVTLLNPIYVSIAEGARVQAHQLEDASQVAVMAGTINRLMQQYNESLLTNTTVRTALLGRQMPIVDKLKKIAQTMGVDMSQVPDLAPAGKFGYVAMANNTLSGPFEIYTGYKETAKSLGELISYKGKRRLSHFEGRCNRLQASAGELRPMPIDPGQRLEMFVPNFCRIVHLEPIGVQKLREGSAIGYVVAPEDFSSAQTNPDNKCFCINGTENNYCSLDGVVEIGPCSYNAPILMTLSHLELDPKITASIQNWDSELYTASGLPMLAPTQMGPIQRQRNAHGPPEGGHLQQQQQEPQAHQLLILRRLGIPIHADLTITLLIKVVRDERFKQMASVPDVSYIPLATIRETVSLPANLGQVIVNLESFLALTYHIKVIMYLSSLVLLCWLTAFYYCGTSVGGAAPSQRQPDRVPAAAPPSGSSGGQSSGAGRNSLANNQLTSHSSLGQRGTRAGPTRPGGGGAASANGGPSQAQADTNSSERANSADSSRSQPPSRRTTSRLGSLEASGLLDGPAGAGPAAEAEAPASGPPNYDANGQRADASLALKLAQMAAASESAATGRPTAQANAANADTNKEPPARLFSKVDEQLSAQQASQMAAASVEPHQLDGRLGDTDEPQQAAGTKRKRSPRSWFMNVYSGFVRMLHGLRSTIGEVGQLDVSENDYQDKQLEMLAGKIDNWYSGQQQQTLGSASSLGRAGSGRPADELDGPSANSPKEQQRVGAAAPSEQPDAADRQRQAGPRQPSDFASSAALPEADKLQQQRSAAITFRATRQRLTDGPRNFSGRDKDTELANEASARSPGKRSAVEAKRPERPELAHCSPSSGDLVERQELQSPMGGAAQPEPRAQSGATSSSQDSAQTTISRRDELATTNKPLGAGCISSAGEEEEEEEDSRRIADEEDAKSKASALEQMEAALNGSPAEVAAAAPSDLSPRQQPRTRMRIRPEMINSSTMTNSGDYGAAPAINLDSSQLNKGEPAATLSSVRVSSSSGPSAGAKARQLQPADQSGGRLNGHQSDAHPPDESSDGADTSARSAAGQQQQQRSLGAPTRRQLGPPGPAADQSGTNASAVQAPGRQHDLMLADGPSEGVKLDSRNGISNNMGPESLSSSSLLTTTGQVSSPSVKSAPASDIVGPSPAETRTSESSPGGQQHWQRSAARGPSAGGDQGSRRQIGSMGESGAPASGTIAASQASIQLINDIEARLRQPASEGPASMSATTRARNGQLQQQTAQPTGAQTNGNNISNGKIMSQQQQRQQQIQDSVRNGMVAA